MGHCVPPRRQQPDEGRRRGRGLRAPRRRVPEREGCDPPCRLHRERRCHRPREPDRDGVRARRPPLRLPAGRQLRVIKNGALLATPFLTVTVNSSGERGLLGVAFDPNFATNQFVYVYYTATTPAIHNRVSRFTANGDVAVAGSEIVLLDLNNLSSATNHNGGAHALRPRRQALRRGRRERQRRERADARQPAGQDPAHQRRRHHPDRQPVLRRRPPA